MTKDYRLSKKVHNSRVDPRIIKDQPHDSAAGQ